MRTGIRHNQTLLVWMQESDQQMQTLEQHLQKQNSYTTASLLSLVQNQLNQSGLAKSVTQLKQADNNSVQISFQKVSFDELMKWLLQLWNEHGLLVTAVSITPTGVPGVVQGDVGIG